MIHRNSETSTPVKVPESKEKIGPASNILLLGSCFTEHIAERLERYKYPVLSNPFGILYNPVSIAQSIKRIINLNFYGEDDLVFDHGLFHSMDHHGVYSSKDKNEVLDTINGQIRSAHQRIKHCAFAFISPGTSRVYRYKKTGQIVGNCHKIPSSEFTREQLTVTDCQKAFEEIYASLKSASPECTVVWTVSPVRHLKDGLTKNQISKATLLLGISEQRKIHPDALYFPAYEIMVDELRDYRYYNRDHDTSFTTCCGYYMGSV